MGMGHCCFAGCTPGPCGCCTRMVFHDPATCKRPLHSLVDPEPNEHYVSPTDDAEKLRLLADWFDHRDAATIVPVTGTELLQDDLRRIADDIEFDRGGIVADADLEDEIARLGGEVSSLEADVELRNRIIKQLLREYVTLSSGKKVRNHHIPLGTEGAVEVALSWGDTRGGDSITVPRDEEQVMIELVGMDRLYPRGKYLKDWT